MPFGLLLDFSPSRKTSLVLLLMLGSLLSGCHSERVAFQFRPSPSNARPITPPIRRLADTTERSAMSLLSYSAPVAAPNTATRPQQPRRIATPLSARPQLAHRVLVRASRSVLPKAAAASRPRGIAVHETRHLLLGIAAVAVGVVTGLLLGGWLGLGVGALIVILGYYFLGMAFGGEHAWLEVFQEFFNM